MMNTWRTSTHTSRLPLRIAFSRFPETASLPAAWWPRSDDLQDEFANLIDEFPRVNGQIAHLEFSYADWNVLDEHPGLHRVAASSLRGLTAISLLAETAGAAGGLVVLTMANRTLLRLLVIPSDADPDLADQILASVSADTNRVSGAELTRLLSPTTSEGQEVWESEGGAFRSDFNPAAPALVLS